MLKQVVMIFGLFFAATHVVIASPAPVADKPALPDDLSYDFKDIPAEQNAIITWRRAAEVEVVPNYKQRQIMKFCWTPSAKEPLEDDLDNLQVWLKRNREALDLFESSLAKSKAKWPKHDVQDKQPQLIALSNLGTARLFVADQLAEHGKFEAAAKSLEDTLKLAQMGIEGEPSLIHYLVACNIRTRTQDAILRLAARKGTPVLVLEQLLTDLPSLDYETNAYSNVLRVEFTHDYYGKIDVERMAVDWSKMSETNIALLFPDDCVRPLKVLLDPSLVVIHPKPYDLKADLENSARHYRIYRTNACSAWSDRSGDVELEHEENQTNLLEEIAPLMELVENEPLPLSRQAVQRARPAYVALENPVGRIMDCSITGFIGSDVKVFHVRTEREATRTLLALMIFERRKGMLPETLSALVEEKILKSIPRDPFSGNEILYSRERRIIWSVGEDGTDDNGKAGDVRWSGEDAVWQIPQIK